MGSLSPFKSIRVLGGTSSGRAAGCCHQHGVGQYKQGAYEFAVLRYDGSGNFRLVEATPATAQANRLIGTRGISRWSFPTTSSYSATVLIMAMSYQAITAQFRTWPSHCRQPPYFPMGWTFAVTTDNNKAMSVQVNGTAGGHILYPGSGNSVTRCHSHRPTTKS